MGTLGRPYRPSFTVPFVYDDSLTLLEQIGRLRDNLNELGTAIENLISDGELRALRTEFNASQVEQTRELRDYTIQEVQRLRIEVRRLIEDISADGVPIEDPTYGAEERPVERVVYNVYDRVRDYGSFSCAEYDAIVAPTITAKGWDDKGAFGAMDFDLHSRRIFGDGSGNGNHNLTGDSADIFAAMGIYSEEDAAEFAAIMRNMASYAGQGYVLWRSLGVQTEAQAEEFVDTYMQKHPPVSDFGGVV